MTTIPTQFPLASESPRDLKFNAGKIDEFVTSLKLIYEDRFGAKHYTIEGLRWVAQQAISAFGYITIDSFQDGAKLTLPNHVLRDKTTGEYYRWDGDFGESGKIVPPGSTPDSTGGIGVEDGYQLVTHLFVLILRSVMARGFWVITSQQSEMNWTQYSFLNMCQVFIMAHFSKTYQMQ